MTTKKGLTIKELYDLLAPFDGRNPYLFTTFMIYDRTNDSYWYASNISYYEDDNGEEYPVLILDKKENLCIPSIRNNEKLFIPNISIIKMTIISLSVKTVMKNAIDFGKGDVEVPFIFGDGSDDIFYIENAFIVTKTSHILNSYFPTLELVVDR